MDVIAVTAANVAGALAPLGTALTEQQIALIWKLHDEPVLCFDGDKAGQKAAMRAIERILPVLEPGKSVRIAVMPEGKDPDDILRHEGAEALKPSSQQPLASPMRFGSVLDKNSALMIPPHVRPFSNRFAIWCAPLATIKHAKPMVMRLNIASKPAHNFARRHSLWPSSCRRQTH